MAVETSIEDIRKPGVESPRARDGDESHLEYAEEGVWIVDRCRRTRYVNARAGAILGYTRDELAGQPVEDHLPPEVLSAFEHLGARGGAEATGRLELCLKRKDGSEVWALIAGGPLLEGGELAGIILFLTDLTERRRLEDELRESARAFEELRATAHIGTWTTRIEHGAPVVRWSEELYRIFGVLPEQFGGTWASFSSFVHPDDLPSVERARAKLREPGDKYTLDYRIVRPDRAVRWVRESATFQWDHAARSRLVGVVQDVTERTQLEQQLSLAQRMEAIGRLAGGVAHDFNNLLTAIRGFGTLAFDSILPHDPAREDLLQVIKTVDRAARLTRQLLAFSKKPVLRPKVLDLGALVRELQPILERMITEDIRLVLDADRIGPKITADPGQIEQVIINLVVNARDAIRTSGKITITVRRATLDAEWARRHPGVEPGPYAALSVSDTGEGMDENVLARIFEPFFTTKEDTRGTGLGLSTAYGIVRQSGGHMEVESAPGSGSTFRVLLPRSDDSSISVELPALRSLSLRGTETLLVVEDDENVRNYLLRALGRLGYRLLEAANGGEALFVAEQHRGPIHALVTDVVMPLLGGGDLAQRLRSARPDLRVLFMSGYAHGPALPKDPERGAPSVFIEKPLVAEELAAKLRELLEGRPS